MRRRGLRNAVWIVAGALALGAGALYGLGESLSRPARRMVGSAPAAWHAVQVALPMAGGGGLSGWYVRGRAGAGAVLLLHGVRADRGAMLGRAELLRREGYGVFLVDLPAHGESSGERITFGWREAEGVKAALAWLRLAAPGERYGVIGVSLGAASLLYSGEKVDAAVLESMYPTIGEAVADRLDARLGAAGRAAAPLLLWQLPFRLGLDPEQLRPIDRIGAMGAPLLIASGAEDRHTTWAETRRLYDAAREPKALLEVPGAAHVDLQAHDPAAYAAAVLPFLRRYLRD